MIHLFEADFNLAIGIYFGRRAMQHQVRHQLIHDGQFGKPHGECQDAALSKVLYNMVAQFSQTPLGQFESDATACFDREVMNFVLTCFRLTGAPMGPLRMWEQTLYNIVHRIKTAYGISLASYSFSSDSPIHGPGQGSRGGPASCSTMTSVLIQAMDKLSHGSSFTDPSQQVHSHQTVKMFIDDASNTTNDFLRWLHEPPTAQQVTTMLQQDAQTWERLLWSSGGLLNLMKCLYYVSIWDFDVEGRAYLLPAATLPNLHLTSGTSEISAPIAHYNSDETHKYLGNFMSPSLQMRTAYQELTTISNNFA